MDEELVSVEIEGFPLFQYLSSNRYRNLLKDLRLVKRISLEHFLTECFAIFDKFVNYVRHRNLAPEFDVLQFFPIYLVSPLFSFFFIGFYRMIVFRPMTKGKKELRNFWWLCSTIHEETRKQHFTRNSLGFSKTTGLFGIFSRLGCIRSSGWT